MSCIARSSSGQYVALCLSLTDPYVILCPSSPPSTLRHALIHWSGTSSLSRYKTKRSDIQFFSNLLTSPSKWETHTHILSSYLLPPPPRDVRSRKSARRFFLGWALGAPLPNPPIALRSLMTAPRSPTRSTPSWITPADLLPQSIRSPILLPRRSSQRMRKRRLQALSSNIPVSVLPNSLSSSLNAYPTCFTEYQLTWILDTLRRTDFSRLELAGETYVDYMGGALYPESLIKVHTDFLKHNILGNTHSVSNR